MTFHFLPDREHRHLLQFYLAPRLGYRTRLAIAGSLILVGLVIQLAWQSADVGPLLVVSVPFLLAGNLFLLVRRYDLRPSQRLFGGTWERTTRDRFQKACRLEEEVRSWDETFGDLTCWTGAGSLAILAAGVGFFCFVLGRSPQTAFWAPVFAVDAAALILPHWITGTRRVWRPLTLRQQINALEEALAAVDHRTLRLAKRRRDPGRRRGTTGDESKVARQAAASRRSLGPPSTGECRIKERVDSRPRQGLRKQASRQIRLRIRINGQQRFLSLNAHPSEQPHGLRLPYTLFEIDDGDGLRGRGVLTCHLAMVAPT